MKKKNVVAGLGEIGLPILQLISKVTPTVGYDINPNLINQEKLKKLEKYQTSILHICIPFTKNFALNVISLSKKFKPEVIVIHSTVKPYTTKKLQNRMPIPIIYSATRGIHKRMIKDLKRYTKFFAISPNIPQAEKVISLFTNTMKKCGVKTKMITFPLTLELAKIIVDTSYYGWLINYAQISKLIADEYEVNYDEMWSFSDEIHKFLGNRPQLYPGFIGGHCVIPNLQLINNEVLNQINKINKYFLKKQKP